MTHKTTMLSPKQSNTSVASTPRKSAAATISLNAFARKRNRSPQRSSLPRIDSEVFQMNGGVLVPHARIQELVGVFGVDSNKRINLWNDSAEKVTRALASSDHLNDTENGTQDTTNERHLECNSDNDESYNENSKRAFGVSFEELFPSALFEISNTGTPPSITLVDVLEKVLQTGEPSMGVPVIRTAGRKRARDEMTNAFSIDFLPQFKSCPMFVSSRNVSGVVLVCKTEHDDSNLIDIARSLTIPGAHPVDKPRSLSAGSSGTCPTENETETETEIDMDKEDSEIDNSFHTCQIDVSHRTNFGIDSSFRSCQIDISTNTVKKSNKRLDALQAFEASDDSDDDDNDDDEDHDHFFNLPSPPLLTSNQRIGNRRTSRDEDCEDDNEDYQRLFETVDSVIFGVDLQGKINEWNHKMEELTGISRQAAKGRSLLEDTSLPFLPFQEKQQHPQNKTSHGITLNSETLPILQRAFHGKSTQQFRLNLKSTEECDGEEEFRSILRLLVASVSPRYNRRGEVMGALFLASDLTNYHMMFHSIKTDAHELRKLIDTANAPIFGIDAHGYVNEWNDKTAEITGYSKDDAYGCLLVDTFIFPGIQDSVRDILHSALLYGKGTSNYELEFKTKSNEIRHLLVNITPQHDMCNVVVGVVLIAQDVTEAVERDRAVASMALELRQLIETANAPIFGIDVHGKVNEWNTRMSTITGFAKEEALETPLVENFIAPSMKEKVGEILEKALNGNETSNYEVEVPSKSGEPIFLLVNATTRRDPDSNVIGVVGVAQDVTEDRKHAKALRDLETVRASQEAKVETERNMTAYFAHELRNPLGAIDSALAAMPDKLPENAQSLVTGMQLCTKFMSSIMNNLLDVRKMEEGKIRLAAAPVSIRQMLHNVHEMLSPSVKAEVEFRKLINVRGNDWVLGDAHRIEQVLTNVVSNAIKYTVSGHIQISIEWEKNFVKFVCEDTGPGIPKSEQAKLFQRFVQRGGAPGTGLGLAIAKHIVDLTGGSIRFESDPSIKAGTTCIVLMALPPCKAPESSAGPKKQEKITEPISVLVIDDIKMNRTMVKRRILKGIAPNAKIKEAATGEEALMICGTEKFDVMIVDQFMEGAGGVMVGTDVVFAMRRMRIDSVLIGCSGNDIGTQFFDAGADMVWQKPMPSNDQIIRDLRSCLDKRGFALSCT